MGVSEVFHEVLSSHGAGAEAAAGSSEIVDYIISMLEDQDFEFGANGEEAFESIGPFLVGPSLTPYYYSYQLTSYCHSMMQTPPVLA